MHGCVAEACSVDLQPHEALLASSMHGLTARMTDCTADMLHVATHELSLELLVMRFLITSSRMWEQTRTIRETLHVQHGSVVPRYRREDG